MHKRVLAALAFGAGLILGPTVALSAPCSASSTTLCLTGRRFTVEARWKDFQGNTGAGRAVSLTSDTGYFWFFSDTNVELVVKVLDARALNGHFWVFYGALSNVEYTMTVRDSETGEVRIYENPSGQFASTGDTLAFPRDASPLATAKPSGRSPTVGIPAYGLAESAVLSAAPEKAAACTPSATALCLAGGRFRLTAAWTDFAGNTGAGQAVGLTSDTGYFWFFSGNNVELVVKALDGRVLNDHFWIFYGALSNVEYTLTVTDTTTGIVRTYQNPPGLFASAGDTSAFGKPTTFQLIDGAVVKGEISAETAFLYKVFAAFGDARLPQAYLGDPPVAADHGILTEVVARWSALSEATRQALDPLLLPPIYAGSAFSKSASSKSPESADRAGSILADWSRIDTARAAVWYRTADAGALTAANNLAAEIENVWTKETGLMGRGPKSDAGQTNNGGDGKLDVYVLPSFLRPDPTDAPDGITPGYRDPLDFLPGVELANVERAAYILIRISAASSPEGARSVLAHEFFHAIAWNQKFADGIVADRWLNEATATWMQDYVYPTQIRNSEHIAGGRYFTNGYKEWLDVPDDGGYADYLFFFYLAREKSPNLNRDIWNNLIGKPSLEAIDTAIPGGFKERWPEFAMYCWDHTGVDQFAQWDNIASGLVDASAEPYVPLFSGNGEGTSLPARAVPHLAMRYAFVEVLSDTIQQLEIQNSPLAASAANAKTQAWIKLANGTTRVEDWTGKSRVRFCRDKTEENITGLMILYTNSGQRTPVVWNEGKVIASSVRCGGFRGTVQESRHVSDAAHTASESMDVTARFLPDPLLTDHYYLAELTMRFAGTAHENVANCDLTIEPVTRTYTFAYGEADLNEIVINKSTEPPTYSATGFWGFIADARAECGGQPGGTVPTGVGGDWWKVPPGFFRVNSDGSLSGNNTETFPGGEAHWTWSFTPD